MAVGGAGSNQRGFKVPLQTQQTSSTARLAEKKQELEELKQRLIEGEKRLPRLQQRLRKTKAPDARRSLSVEITRQQEQNTKDREEILLLQQDIEELEDEVYQDEEGLFGSSFFGRAISGVVQAVAVPITMALNVPVRGLYDIAARHPWMVGGLILATQIVGTQTQVRENNDALQQNRTNHSSTPPPPTSAGTEQPTTSETSATSGATNSTSSPFSTTNSATPLTTEPTSSPLTTPLPLPTNAMTTLPPLTSTTATEEPTTSTGAAASTSTAQATTLPPCDPGDVVEAEVVAALAGNSKISTVETGCDLFMPKFAGKECEPRMANLCVDSLYKSVERPAADRKKDCKSGKDFIEDRPVLSRSTTEHKDDFLQSRGACAPNYTPAPQPTTSTTQSTTTPPPTTPPEPEPHSSNLGLGIGLGLGAAAAVGAAAYLLHRRQRPCYAPNRYQVLDDHDSGDEIAINIESGDSSDSEDGDERPLFRRNRR